MAKKIIVPKGELWSVSVFEKTYISLGYRYEGYTKGVTNEDMKVIEKELKEKFPSFEYFDTIQVRPKEIFLNLTIDRDLEDKFKSYTFVGLQEWLTNRLTSFIYLDNKAKTEKE